MRWVIGSQIFVHQFLSYIEISVAPYVIDNMYDWIDFFCYCLVLGLLFSDESVFVLFLVSFFDLSIFLYLHQTSEHYTDQIVSLMFPLISYLSPCPRHPSPAYRLSSYSNSSKSTRSSSTIYSQLIGFPTGHTRSCNHLHIFWLH